MDTNSSNCKVHHVDSDEPAMCDKDKYVRNQTYKNMAKEIFFWCKCEDGRLLIN
jgi:hypothetical protein